jgi:hypothetical protein
MRVENPKSVVEPGAGRTGKLAMVAYQFQHACLSQLALLAMDSRDRHSDSDLVEKG